MAKASSKFLGSNWGLQSKESQCLYHEVVEPLRKEKGLIDHHNHFSPAEIAENQPLGDAFQAMVYDPSKGNCDHYIVQLMAGAGVPFSATYGSMNTFEKWMEFARVFPQMAGTQVGVWTQLEINNILGVPGMLSADTGLEMWQAINKKLKDDPNFRPQALLKNGGFRMVGTTDNAVDDLRYHKQMKFGVQVLPTFRPDAQVNIENGNDWRNAVQGLLELTKQSVSLDGLVEALRMRHQFFVESGAKATDHGMTIPYGHAPDREAATKVFRQVYKSKEVPTEVDIAIFKSYLMDEIVRMNRDNGLVTQIHFGIRRNTNGEVMANHGRDRGGDGSDHTIDVYANLAPLLSKYAGSGDRGKDAAIVLYTANPSLYSTLATMIRVFPGTYTGTTWWWEDNYQGMRKQFSEMSPIIGWNRWVGMTCDGRKVLSASTRHDVAARAVCAEIGESIENGLVHKKDGPRLVKDVLYNTQARLFGVK